MNALHSAQTLKRPLPPEMIAALQGQFAERFSMANAVRDHHGKDESPFPSMLPDGVVFAQSTDEVVAVVKLCAQFHIPLIPYGAGSSLEGHILAIQGGISLDLTAMNKIVSLNAEDQTVTVQAGLTRKQLNEQIRDTGLFFPIDPGADASLGGMSATRASGTNAVRYGTMRENVVSLTVVTADGKVIRTARRARKSS
ncbi:MAG: FAD-binding oxidoreductase, partial [Zwartia sp.]